MIKYEDYIIKDKIANKIVVNRGSDPGNIYYHLASKNWFYVSSDSEIVEYRRDSHEFKLCSRECDKCILKLESEGILDFFIKNGINYICFGTLSYLTSRV